MKPINFLKYLILILSLTVSLHSYASPVNPCDVFIGKFLIQKSKNDTYAIKGLEIKTDSTNTDPNVTIYYKADSPLGFDWTEAYIADGLAHPGNMNTGSSYTVSCLENKISISRLGLLSIPLITTLTLNANQLNYLQNATDEDAKITSMKFQKLIK